MAADPVRLVHHLSCTGGTLLSRYVASIPGIVLLSEVNPGPEVTRHFSPLDPVFQLYVQCAGFGEADYLAEQARRYRLCLDAAAERGATVVLRDHAHSDFLSGPIRPARLRALVNDGLGLATRSLVTVRHPIDSWLGMNAARFAGGVAHFHDYCRRYLAFLDAYAGAPVVRYEDFVADPVAAGRRITAALDLPAWDDVSALHGVRLTGDSGRGRRYRSLRALKRRKIPARLAGGLVRAAEVDALFARLGYPFDP
jgi:hypothetical protein